MTCMDCCQIITDQNDHWADCEAAPDFVRFQAKAERRAKAGGPFAPGFVSDRTQAIPSYRHKCGHFVDGADVRRNHIDRGEPFPKDVDCRPCQKAAAR